MRTQYNAIGRLYLLTHQYTATNEIKLKWGENNANEFSNSKEAMILFGRRYYLLNFSLLNLTVEFQLRVHKIN